MNTYALNTYTHSMHAQDITGVSTHDEQHSVSFTCT